MKNAEKVSIYSIPTFFFLFIFYLFGEGIYGYKDGFELKIGKDGIIRNITYNKKLLIKRISIYGKYLEYNLNKKDAFKKDTRVFQKKKVDLIEGTYNFSPLVIKGVLVNKYYPEGLATYEQIIYLYKERLEIEVKVKLKSSVYSHSNVFQSIVAFSCDTVVGKGIKIIKEKGAEMYIMIPFYYTKEFKKDIFPILSEVDFSLKEGVLRIVCLDNTKASIVDAREWGGNTFNIFVFEDIPWKKNPWKWEKGKLFSWKFIIFFKKFEE